MAKQSVTPNMAGDQYQQFLARKAIIDPMTGLQGKRRLPKQMFQIQRDVTGWMIRRGRAALLSGTGTGKTIMELGWGDEIRKETKRPIMQFAPLAVSAQIVREANKFGIPARLVTSNLDCDPDHLCIANYQKMHHFRMSDFGGCTLDESGILKSVDGHFRNLLIDQCKDIPFRIAATATPAPNDFMEIGNHAEFLGIMSYTDMLATFFIHDGGDTQKWRLKGHAEQEFWKWFASWAVMYRMPSDLGYSDEGYELPPLVYHQHTVTVEHDPAATGFLIPMQAQSLSERLTARRTSINDRISEAVSIVTKGICAKHPEWQNQDGSLNIRQIASLVSQRTRNMPRVSPSREFAAPALQKKTKNICGPTMPQTNTSGLGARKSSGMPTTQLGVRNTPQTRNIETSRRKSSETDAPRQREIQSSRRPLASPAINTMPSSKGKMEGAPYAIGGMEMKQEGDSTSITATKQALSEDYSVATAISVSENFETTEICSVGQSNICQILEIDQWIIWCNLNDEQDRLKKEFGPLAISIHGGQSDTEKEGLHQSWINGDAPIIICKPSMFGHGLNWQHCHNMIFVGLNDSFEQYYQSIRRCWRFGQTQTVNCHIIAAETEGAVVSNIRRKEADADRMMAAMIMHMKDLSSEAVRGQVRDTPAYNPTLPMIVPEWLK